MSENVFDEETLREIAREKVKKRLSVQIHAVVFLVVNAFLFIINWLTSTEYWWAFWPLFSWLIGLVFHWVSYSVYARGVTTGVSKGIIYHLTAYILVVVYLAWVNWFTMLYGDYLYWWIVWVAVPWAVGLILHIYMATHQDKPKEDERSYVDRKVERELAKIKKKQGEAA